MISSLDLTLEGRRTFVWTFESDNVFSRDNALQFDSNKSTDCKNFLKAAEEETFYEECQRSVGKQKKCGKTALKKFKKSKSTFMTHKDAAAYKMVKFGLL